MPKYEATLNCNISSWKQAFVKHSSARIYKYTWTYEVCQNKQQGSTVLTLVVLIAQAKSGSILYIWMRKGPHKSYGVIQPFDQIWPKEWKKWSEKWVGLDEKMVLWLWNFGHSLSSSYYTIYVLRSKIWPNLTKKVKKLIRKMSGARWKNGPMTPKLWPWPILIILHDICKKKSFFKGHLKPGRLTQWSWVKSHSAVLYFL